MNNIISFNITTPGDVAKQIAARVKARRLELNLTQEGIAARAGLNLLLTVGLNRQEKYH